MAKVAFLVANDFEDSEMKNPYEEITKAGHEAVVIGLEKGIQYKGKKGTVAYISELTVGDADANEYDAVVIPGGSAPEDLRVNDEVVKFVKEMHNNSAVIAGICHGPQVMISADILKGHVVTSYRGIRDDVINGGATFIDKEVVVSNNIITSRTPKDEPAFIREILAKLNS
ncbi:type 1 glutamine amidotransferase domain-containing protein [Fredinandcohnia sp. QZ13]|uniref:type 1 glutamine amidotransferase domain-containing protein n=1 Tax=Fredinandcohnia sp. QZ13 TaxID=3073144 RepID=UPI0028535257|nr:type 1 glutamine amidotransferase domain-containing protein [Fredinandcohnia sp. QZ13]MDR4889547.1 type 1 glutamine amidotransferase domain-containing protein [Fredinandcohnia sp. QZ13]